AGGFDGSGPGCSGNSRSPGPQAPRRDSATAAIADGALMADDFASGDKTELPTDRRREEIRERGNVARSTDLSVAVSVLAAASVLYFFGGELALSLVEVLRKSLSA